jgi:kumamolisin
MPARTPFAAAWIALGCLCLLVPRSPAATSAGMRTLRESVRLPEPGGLTIGRARVVRALLTPDERSATVNFSVSLRMRAFGALQARLASGAPVGAAEMESSYLPLRSDYDRVASWLFAQGFTPGLVDHSHMIVFARGTVADLARVFGLQFSRVAVADGEYTSAVTAPAVPEELADVVLGVNGLQPQFRLRPRSAAAVAPRDMVGGFIYITPDNVASAYNIPPSATGAGQAIAIVGEAAVLDSDLTTFWTTAGVTQTAANVTTINVDGGPSSPSTGLTNEAALDVEWAGAIAPAAGIRLYLAPNVLECFAQILNDVPSQPSMRVVSISFGDTEGDEGAGALQTYSQVAASFAAAGVSVFAASGDAGSNPIPGGENYSPAASLAVDFPASDPSVTGVGGTTLTFTGDWDFGSESVWDEIASAQTATGGGVSAVFAKPSWQAGGPVLAGETMRCVPDVAAISNSNLVNVNLGGSFLPANATDVGALTYVDGQATALGGTSLACPIWAAIGALINQGRASAGAGPIGLLNPHLYPLSGTGSFNDVTSGSNGAYSAGPGYDLCSGLGSPNVARLIAALGGFVDSHRLVDVSTRAQVLTGANVLIAGFSINGPSHGTKSVLVRGIGPALSADFSIAGALAQPILQVYDSTSTLIATNSGWTNAPVGGTSSVASTFRAATASDMTAAGAFQLAAGSNDSAMVLTLPSGDYTVEVAGAGSATGVALAEVYELSTTAPELLVNISSRCFVGTGSGVAICGFAIGGFQPMEVLVRGIGPGLSAFGLSATLLPQPSIEVFDSTSIAIATDTGWGHQPVAGPSSVAATFRQATAADMSTAGAFALTPGSADSAIVLTLPPGDYTVVVSGVGDTAGTALAEVYELSPL